MYSNHLQEVVWHFLNVAEYGPLSGGRKSLLPSAGLIRASQTLTKNEFLLPSDLHFTMALLNILLFPSPELLHLQE